MEKEKKDVAEESRLMQLYLSKQSFLERYWADDLIAILKQWRGNCKNFCDFEELYIIVKIDLITKDFYLEWLNSTKIYEEKLQVYSCVMKAFGFWAGQELVKAWVDQLWSDSARSLPEIQKAMALTYHEDEEFKNELEKILKL